MLQIGLTGGIGAGKSTVARRFRELGATVLDADVVAREVVSPGTPGLAQVGAVFGRSVLTEDGSLDRPALARIVFADSAARQRLNAIVHPLVRSRTAELVEAAPQHALVVQDIPLLVEGDLAPSFALVVVVDASEDERVRRLVADRGMTPEEATSRMAAQADEQRRRAAADVWLDNSGAPERTRAEIDQLWRHRLMPFERNVRLDRPRRPSPPRLVASDPCWPAQYARLAARVARAAGDRGLRVDHIGSTSVPGLVAKDVLDIQLTVPSLDSVPSVVPALRTAGFRHEREIDQDNPKPTMPDPGRWRKQLFTSCDPARPVNLHVRVLGSPGWRFALLMRDWLRERPRAREEYAALKLALADAHADDADTSGYTEAKEPWFDSVSAGAQQWARETGWRPPD